MKFSLLSIILHLAFIAIWTFILNWICSKGLVWVSWLLVVLPYVYMFLVILIAAEFLALSNMQRQGLLM
jgi:hypothetical protein